MIKKETLLQYIPDIQEENEVNPNRVLQINDKHKTEGKIVYLVTREFRLEDNFAFNYALEKSENKDLTILFYPPEILNENKKNFFDKNFEITLGNYKTAGVDIFVIRSEKELNNYLSSNQTRLLIKDFNPIEKINLKDYAFKIEEVDSHNILPAFYISNQQEYNAAAFRRKVYYKIAEFMTSYPKKDYIENESSKILKDFISDKLNFYKEYKNNPVKNVTSNLSHYLNYGFISSQKIALEIIKSSAPDEDKEVFLEELIVRKELSDNFCLYNKNYISMKGLPSWAKYTLDYHKHDIRIHNYSKEQLENAQTSDNLWNAAQKELLKTGKIHGYMRMYWAKKLLEWVISPQEAINIAIYLNDKYAFDAPSPNGYVGILWSIGGLHDRPFKERPISGQIRMMTYNGAKSKFNVNEYCSKWL